jgi:peroxiredoxin
VGAVSNDPIRQRFARSFVDQLALYYELLPLFAEHRAQVLGISVDRVWSHRAFAKDRNLRFPTSSRKALSRELTACIARKIGPASARCSSSMVSPGRLQRERNKQ